MRNPDHWDLIQIVSRQRFDNLTSAELFQRINALSGEDQKNWYAWRAGMPNWACVVQLKQHDTSVNAVSQPELKLLQPSSLAQESAAQIVPATALPQAERSLSEAPDRRKHRRHAVRTKIVILFNGQTYRAFSKDISVGGLLLLNQIPWRFEDSNCSVFVTNPQGGQALEFTGKVLSDPQDPCRVQFQSPSEGFLQTLSQWLEGAKLNSMKSAA